MANYDGEEKPISELLEIAFETLKEHEKRIDDVVAKLSLEKDDLAGFSKRFGTKLERILQKLGALEQEVKKLQDTLQT